MQQLPRQMQIGVLLSMQLKRRHEMQRLLQRTLPNGMRNENLSTENGKNGISKSVSRKEAGSYARLTVTKGTVRRGSIEARQRLPSPPPRCVLPRSRISSARQRLPSPPPRCVLPRSRKSCTQRTNLRRVGSIRRAKLVPFSLEQTKPRPQ